MYQFFVFFSNFCQISRDFMDQNNEYDEQRKISLSNSVDCGDKYNLVKKMQQGLRNSQQILLFTFLVGAFSLKEKSPTLTVSSFFCFFQLTISLWVVHFSYNSAILRRRQTLLQRVPLSVFTFSRKHTQPDVPKGSPLWIFFGTVRLFFEKIFIVPKGSPLRVFSYFATECMLIHHKGSPLLHFSALCDFFWKNFFFKNSCFFPKNFFCAFWALDMAPTLDVLVLLYFPTQLL